MAGFFLRRGFRLRNRRQHFHQRIERHNLIQAYRDYGRFKRTWIRSSPTPEGDLALKNFGLTEADLDSVYSVGEIVGLKDATLREIIAHLQKCYCGTITVQSPTPLKACAIGFMSKWKNRRDIFG